MSFQKLILCGELTTEPELRYNQSGVPCCAFRLRTVETWAGADGQIREDAENHRILVWGRDAEKISKEARKGLTVMIEGRNKTRLWKAENGLDIEITEVVAVPNGVRFPGGTRPALAPTRDRPKSPATPSQNQPAEGSKLPPITPAGPVSAEPSAPKEEKAKRPSPVKPAPPKPEKVHVDLAELAKADDLPF